MAINPDIQYNFNENSASVIRDYTENKEDGTGTGLVVQASSRVGNEAVFDGSTSKIERSAITYLSNVSGITIWMSIKFDVSTGTDYIFNINGILDCTWDGTTLTANLTTTTASYSATNDITAISTGTYYDILIRLNSSNGNFRIGVDGVNQSATATLSNTPVLSPDLDIGWDGATDYGKFTLNEFKLFNESISPASVQPFIDEQNGVKITSGTLHGLLEGDIIGTNINTTVENYAIVTYIESTTIFRMQPLTDNVAVGSRYSRVGHLWDTTRQYMLVIDDTPQICFYNGISLSSEVLSSAKKTVCIDKDGITVFNPPQEDDTLASDQDDYTLTDIDLTNVLRLDSTGSDIKITGIVPPSPVFSKELTIVWADASKELKIQHNDSGSTAANRFFCPDNSEFILQRNSGVKITYDTTSSRWRLIAKV